MVPDSSSMTTLLLRTIEHFTGPSLMLTTKKILIKHFRSCVQLSKSCQKLDIIFKKSSTFKIEVVKKYQ